MALNMRMPCSLLDGKPNSSTPGWVGMLVMDTTSASGDIYKCTAVNNNGTTWRIIATSGGGGGGTGADGVSVTDAEVRSDGNLWLVLSNGTEIDAGQVVPVKGTDYFTETDKVEMVSAVIALLPVYGGETE